MTRLCVVCGSPLKAGRRKYCGIVCSQVGEYGHVLNKYTQCEFCGRELVPPRSDRMCSICKEIGMKRHKSREDAHNWETLLRMRELRERETLSEFREHSKCFRCEWGRPVGGTMVFCPAADGTCFKKTK